MSDETAARRGNALRLVGLVAGIAAVLALLHLAGRGSLAAPPLRSWGAFRGWLHDRDGITAAFAILRLFALVLAWYVAVAVALGSVGRLVGTRRLVAVTDAATVRPLRRLLANVAGAGLAGAATLAVAPAVVGSLTDRGPPAAETSADPSDGDELVLVGDGPTVGDRLTLLPGDDGTATMHRLPDSPTSWTVQPGDHFWGIAEETLAAAWGRPPTDKEIDPYWRQLVEVNRSRLAHSDNADLIFPGQVFELPPTPPPPS